MENSGDIINSDIHKNKQADPFLKQEKAITGIKRVEVKKSDLNKLAFRDLSTSLKDVGGLSELLQSAGLPLSIIMAIGVSDLGPVDPGTKALQSLLVVGSAITSAQILGSRYENVFRNPTSKVAYPEIIGKVPLPKIEQTLTDNANGVYGISDVVANDEKRAKVNPYSREWREKLYSLKDYKRTVFESLGRNIETVEDANSVWNIVMSTSQPELKLQGINLLTQKCKPFLKDVVVGKTSFTSDLDEAVTKHLKTEWWGIRDEKPNSNILENLKEENIFKNAQSIYETISSEIDAPVTLKPYLKLFVVRNIFQGISENKVPSASDQEFVSKLKTQLIGRLSRSEVLEKERQYSPEEPTVGFEMQPKNNHGELKFTKMDIPQIKKLIDYAGLGWQNDMPFEVIFPPTRTPAAQSLMLGEVLYLTGITMDSIGVQINFGGLTSEKNVKALQRIMLAAGRLIPDSKMSVHGDSWDLGSSQKGEVNMRDISSGTLPITPPDKDRPEFNSVGEYRVPVNAKDFFSFYRGMLMAHSLASAAKAQERQEKGYTLTESEQRRVSLFEQVKSEFNEFCERKGIPLIDKDWSVDDWRKYGQLVENKYSIQYFQKYIEAESREVLNENQL